MEQKIINANGDYCVLDEWLQKNKSIMLVCGKSIEKQKINEYFNAVSAQFGLKIIRFSGFTPNPTYESVIEGVKLFRQEKCDSLIAVGGGSAIDVAKCIKLFSNMGGNGKDGSFLSQQIIPNNIPFLAIPTTAGTGSEATKYAVIYYNGEKQSITHENCIPDTVLLDASLLKTLPDYQRKATMCDALCHAIESFWSVNSTEESKKYSKCALEGILKHMEGYLNNTDEGNAGMLLAANMAGKAINITQTTAGHAMCYKITSKYGIAHGHAAILCNQDLFRWMVENIEKCTDLRGKDYLWLTFEEIATIMSCLSPEQAAWKLKEIFLSLDLNVPHIPSNEIFNVARKFTSGINQNRLKNNPIELDNTAFWGLYQHILNPKYAFIDNFLIKLSNEIKTFFSMKHVKYNKKADPERRILDFLNNRERWLSVTPYTVSISKELDRKIRDKNFFDENNNQVPETEADNIIRAFNHIKQKIENGEDVNFNQSRGIFDQTRKDTLLNIWGVRHIHLSEKDAMSKTGMQNNRADFLLFFIENEENILCLDIIHHPETSKKFICYNFLKIMYSNNWIETTHFKASDASYVPGSLPKITNDDDLAELYFNGKINKGFEFEEKLFIPVNGLTTSGHNVCDVRRLLNLKNFLGRDFLQLDDKFLRVSNFTVNANGDIRYDLEFLRNGNKQKIQFGL